VTKPLALMAHERVLPGGQLVNRLQDMGYRVTTTHLAGLTEVCHAEKPLLVIVDLMPRESDAVSVVERLKSNPETNHLPVIAYAPEKESGLIDSARKAGATLVVTDTAITTHLDRFLQQALQLD
jgi:CheY-like chemotaxis protein